MAIDVNIIPELYQDIMRNYSFTTMENNPVSMENGYYHVLYAPGYENNGVADIVANCV